MEKINSLDLIRKNIRFLLLGIWILLYFILTILHRFQNTSTMSLAFGLASMLTQVSLDIIIYLSIRRYGKAFLGSTKASSILQVGFLSAAVADAAYGLSINVFGLVDTRGTAIELVYNIPFTIFLVSLCLFWTEQIRRNLQLSWGKIFLIGSAIVSIFAYIYLSKTAHGAIGLQTTFITLICLIAQAGTLMGAIPFFVFATNIASQFISAGSIAICSVNLLLQYLEFSGQLETGIPFEAFWVLGQLTFLVGIWLTKQKKSHFVQGLNFNFKNIRAKFIINLLGLLVALHLLWHVFFENLIQLKNKSGYIEVYLFFIFFSVLLMPLALLFQRLCLSPILQMIDVFYNKNMDSTFLKSDEELYEVSLKIVNKISELERNRIESETINKMVQQMQHDIRSPLAALKVISNAAVNIPQDIKILLLGATQRIENMVKDFEDLKANNPPVKGMEEISHLVADLITEKKVEFLNTKNFNIELINFITPGKSFTLVNTNQLKRALSNLINNAFESVPAGRESKILITMKNISDYIAIEIADNGVGIPSEMLSKIGQRGVTFQKNGGTGLGVYFVRQTVEQLGGQVRVESVVDVGTKITLMLPIMECTNSSEIKVGQS